jgi:hypothetical protein
LKSAVWIATRESKASFAIEHESENKNRVKRFASALEHFTGQVANPFAEEFLGLLQAEILGSKALRTGLRKSPVFIGSSSKEEEIVHSIAPHWEETAKMLNALGELEKRTRQLSPIIRASIDSFGFVYIHPMSDGNGRISRFLINNDLRWDMAIPFPVLVPISATITRNSTTLASYHQILDSFSKPLVSRYQASISFGKPQTNEDGVKSDFEFSSYEDASFAWRFIDLTVHAAYLGDVIKQSIEIDMRAEAQFLVDLYATRERLKEVFEAPDPDIDRIIRSIKENKGIVSGKLITEYPLLSNDQIRADAISAVMGTDYSA